MEKYVVGLFVFVALVAIAGFLTDAFIVGDNNIQGALIIGNGRVAQRGALVSVGNIATKIKESHLASPKPVAKATVKKTATKKVVPAKTAQTGLIIVNGMPYTMTPMQGIVHIKGLPISVNTLEGKGITLVDGKLLTPDGKDVQIRDAELRRKPIAVSRRMKK